MLPDPFTPPNFWLLSVFTLLSVLKLPRVLLSVLLMLVDLLLLSVLLLSVLLPTLLRLVDLLLLSVLLPTLLWLELVLLPTLLWLELELVLLPTLLWLELVLLPTLLWDALWWMLVLWTPDAAPTPGLTAGTNALPAAGATCCCCFTGALCEIFWASAGTTANATKAARTTVIAAYLVIVNLLRFVVLEFASINIDGKLLAKPQTRGQVFLKL